MFDIPQLRYTRVQRLGLIDIFLGVLPPPPPGRPGGLVVAVKYYHSIELVPGFESHVG